MPHDVAGAGAVVVVDLYQPILMADGDDQIAVELRIEDCVCMGPVRVHIGMAVDIQVIELVPQPNRMVILV